MIAKKCSVAKKGRVDRILGVGVSHRIAAFGSKSRFSVDVFVVFEVS